MLQVTRCLIDPTKKVATSSRKALARTGFRQQGARQHGRPSSNRRRVWMQQQLGGCGSGGYYTRGDTPDHQSFANIEIRRECHQAVALANPVSPDHSTPLITACNRLTGGNSSNALTLNEVCM